jgi:hypothetical protein
MKFGTPGNMVDTFVGEFSSIQEEFLKILMLMVHKCDNGTEKSENITQSYSQSLLMGTSVLRRIQIQGIWITGAPLYR